MFTNSRKSLAGTTTDPVVKTCALVDVSMPISKSVALKDNLSSLASNNIYDNIGNWFLEDTAWFTKESLFCKFSTKTTAFIVYILL